MNSHDQIMTQNEKCSTLLQGLLTDIEQYSKKYPTQRKTINIINKFKKESLLIKFHIKNYQNSQMDCDDAFEWMDKNYEEHTVKKYLTIKKEIMTQKANGIETPHETLREYLSLLDTINFALQEKVNSVRESTMTIFDDQNDIIDIVKLKDIFVKIEKIVNDDSYIQLHNSKLMHKRLISTIKTHSVYCIDSVKKYNKKNEDKENNPGINFYYEQFEKFDSELTLKVKTILEDQPFIIKQLGNIKFHSQLYHEQDHCIKN